MAKPIGWDKSSLKDMLIKSEKLFEETAHYHGIENLSLKEENPFRYERAYTT